MWWPFLSIRARTLVRGRSVVLMVNSNKAVGFSLTFYVRSEPFFTLSIPLGEMEKFVFLHRLGPVYWYISKSCWTFFYSWLRRPSVEGVIDEEA